MFPGKLLNFKLNRGIVQRDAKFLQLLSTGMFTFRSRMSFIYKCNPRSLTKTNLL